MDRLLETPHQQAIQRCYVKLLHNVILQPVLDELYSLFVITEEDMRRISSHPNPDDQCRNFFSIMRCKDQKSFNKLCNVLRQVKQEHVANVLESAYKDREHILAIQNLLIPYLRFSIGQFLCFEDFISHLKKHQNNPLYEKCAVDSLKAGIIQEAIEEVFPDVKIENWCEHGDKVYLFNDDNTCRLIVK